MATVTYEVYTKVRKTFAHNKLRGYRFTAHLIVTDMTEHNFHQLKRRVDGDSIVIRFNEFLPSTITLTKMVINPEAALKTAITTYMDNIKTKYENLLNPLPTKKNPVKLTEGGVFKNTFTELSDL